MSQQRTSKDKGERKYTSIACLECRKRKVKCNNGRPRCSNCSLYDTECVYGQDRRRMSESSRRKAGVPANGPKEEVIDNTHGAHNDTAEPPDIPDHESPSNWDNFALHDFQEQSHQPGVTGFDSPALAFSYSHQEWGMGTDPGLMQGPGEPSLDLNSQQALPFLIEPSLHLQSSTQYGGKVASSEMDPSDLLDSQPPYFDWRSPQQTSGLPYISSFKIFGETPETSPASQDNSPNALNVGNLSSDEPGTKVGRPRPQDMADDDLPSLNDVTKQLTSRLGRLQIAEDGQPRYYGATSNLHLLHSRPNSLVQPNIRNVITHGDAAIAQAGLQWEGDSAYEDHLINLFFSWHNALMYVLDKDIFFNERRKFQQGQTTDLYSPSLENAVYTIGTAYTDRSHPAVKDATDEFFAFRSKAYLDIEIDSPTIATAQALLILSSHEAAHARESRGWIYSGMAVQIMTDLGLHLNLEKDHSQLDARDVNTFDDSSILRRNLFWSTNTVDTLWSAHCGRPSLMKHLKYSVQGPLPSRTYMWEYYTDEYSTLKFPPNFDFAAAAHVHVYLASLMKILARVSEVLYSGVPDVSNDIGLFVAQADADFQEWLALLPQNLRLNLSVARAFYLPAVLELHLSYYECIILLYRPLITPEDVTTEPRSDSPLSKCIVSAQEICKILVLFRKMYGLRRPHHHMVHVTMTAALIHIFQLYAGPGPHENKDAAQRDFLTCLQALGEMGQTYKSASRALDVVTSLRQSWQDDTFGGDKFKRPKLE